MTLPEKTNLLSFSEGRRTSQLLPKRRDSKKGISWSYSRLTIQQEWPLTSAPKNVNCCNSHAFFLQRFRHLEPGFTLLQAEVFNAIKLQIFGSCILNKLQGTPCMGFWKRRERGKINKNKKITFIFHVTLPVLYNVYN